MFDIHAYTENGYFVQEDVFDASWVEYLVQEAQELPNYQSGTHSTQLNPHRHRPSFVMALRSALLVPSVERIVDAEASGLQSQYFWTKPGTSGVTPHQDAYIVDAEGDFFVSAWIALTDVDAANGGMIVWPRSHQEGRLPVRPIKCHQRLAQDGDPKREIPVLPKGRYAARDVPMSPGSVLWIHGNLVHGSRPNKTSSRWRHALLCTYIKKGEKFRPGNVAKRAEIDLYGSL